MVNEIRPHYTRELFRLLSNHRKAFFLITSATTLLALGLSIVVLIASPNYEASATLNTLPTREEIKLAANRHGGMAGITPAQLMSQTHTEVLLSKTLAATVVSELLNENTKDGTSPASSSLLKQLATSIRQSLYSAKTFLNFGKIEEPNLEEALVERLRRSTRVGNVPGSYVLRVTVLWDDPEIAAMAANRVCEAYATRLEQEREESIHSASLHLAKKMAESKEKLQLIDQRMEEFKQDTGVYAGSHDLELKMNELSRSLQDLNETRVQINELDTKIELLKSYHTPTELAEIQAQREGVVARKTALDEVILDQMAALERFPAHETKWLKLVREKLDLEKVLNGFRERLLDLRVMEGADTPLVQTIDPATPPAYPVSPKVFTNTVVGSILGFFLSCGYAVGINVLRNDVRSPDVLAQFGPPVVGVVPFDNRHRDWEAPVDLNKTLSDKPGTHSSMVTTHAEHLMHDLAGSGNKVFIVSSTLANVGKSYTLKRLVEQGVHADKKVLALDLDRREPCLHEVFGIQPKTSLSSVALGQAELKDAIVRKNDNLDFAGSTGGETAYGSSRWQINRIKEALAAIVDQYDLILIDSAAMRRDPLVTQLWDLADQILVVVDAMETSVSEVEEFLKRSSNSRDKIRMVLNKVRYKPDFLFEA